MKRHANAYPMIFNASSPSNMFTFTASSIGDATNLGKTGNLGMLKLMN
jgi:hypothetical protein